MVITRKTDDNRLESDIERNFQRRIRTFDNIPNLKQLGEGQMGKVLIDGEVKLYIRHKSELYLVASATKV